MPNDVYKGFCLYCLACKTPVKIGMMESIGETMVKHEATHESPNVDTCGKCGAIMEGLSCPVCDWQMEQRT